jgi:BirA family transcriptional regulator, biotin operon repressor / biotin---[acetyl-CoA-carboxylase] ligase
MSRGGGEAAASGQGDGARGEGDAARGVEARLGWPRFHLRETDSTNARACELAIRGAPHGALVTASVQSSGRGRQGRTWSAPPGRALLCSLIVRPPPRLLSLVAGVAVAEAIGPGARVKWPNDVLIGGGKVAGILVEGRPQEGWAVLGIGLNVAVRDGDLPPELRGVAATLGLEPAEIESVLAALMESLERWLAESPAVMLAALRDRDALHGALIEWAGGRGRGVGIDDDGRLLVDTGQGRVTLNAGEVHLRSPAAGD